MFSFDTTFDSPLIPDQWPVFDEVVLFSPFSTSSSVTTSPSVLSDPLPPAFPSADLASMPIPPSRSPPRNKNPNHIPRPRNAFMLFRSAFASAQKITPNIEHDNRHITRIIAYCWNRLSEADKQVWRDKAAAEKIQHAQRYPNYRFSPVGRAKKAKKRKVRRNSEKDVNRCQAVANLVMSGTCGTDLELAMREVDLDRNVAARHGPPDVFTSDEKRTTLFALDPLPNHPEIDVPPFRSPLLPPAKTTPQDGKNTTLQPLVAPAYPLGPQTGINGGVLHGDLSLKPLFYQYYQPNDTPSSPSTHPPTHYQSVLNFVQNNPGHGVELEPSAPDFSIFTWNPSNDFAYHR